MPTTDTSFALLSYRESEQNSIYKKASHQFGGSLAFGGKNLRVGAFVHEQGIGRSGARAEFVD